MKNALGEKKIVKLHVQWLKLFKILPLIKKTWSSVLQEIPVRMGDVAGKSVQQWLKARDGSQFGIHILDRPLSS